MRITDIALNSNDSEIAVFSFRNPASTGKYVAKAVIGLDTDEIVSKFYNFGLTGKTRFYDISLTKRNIVMRIALNPRSIINETSSDLRDDLYKAISSNRTGEVQLYFYAGSTLISYLSGFVTKVEVPHFSKLSEIQITIHCSNPLMRAVNPVRLETNQISATNPVIVADNLSTAPHGFKFNLTFNMDTTSFTIQDKPTPDWKFVVTPGTIAGQTGFKTGDVLYFSSDYNDKQLYIIRASTTYPVIDKIQLGSVWPVLFPGQNDFHIISNAFTWNQIEYYAAYWGV
jgi:hypothetical protein